MLGATNIDSFALSSKQKYDYISPEINFSEELIPYVYPVLVPDMLWCMVQSLFILYWG